MLPLNRNIVTLKLKRVWVQKCCHRTPQKFSHCYGPVLAVCFYSKEFKERDVSKNHA